MEIWENDDDERPIETYPGYLASVWDGTFVSEPILKPLEGFDFRKYSELVDDDGGQRQLSVALDWRIVPILFTAYDDVARTLDQLPTIKVYLDNGPPDAGPASGGTYLFFIADDFTELAVEQSIAALAAALEADFAFLEGSSRG